MTGRRPFKRMYNHQPGQCIQMCKQDESCRFLSIDYLSGICEFFDDPQQNEQLVANLLGLGSRLSKRSVDLLVGSDRRPEEVGRRIVARLNVSDLNLESEFPPLDDASLDDIGPDGETITFLPEPAANPFPILEHTGTSTVLPMNSTQSTSHSISTSTSRPPTEPSTTTYSSVSITATESSVTTTHRIPITITSVASTTHVTSKPISVATTSAHTASSSTPTSTAVTIHQTNPPQLSTIATTSKASTATLTSTSIKMPVQTSTSPSIALTSSKPSTVTLSQTAYPNTSQSTMRPTVTSTTSAQPTTPSSVPESQQISISPNRPEMNGDLEPCSHCAHFTKVCLSELNSCGTDWTFEVNSGFTLKAMPNSPSAESGHFLAERIVSNVINRADCQSECLKTNRLQTDRLPSTIGSNASTDSFVCRSAVFDPTNRSCRLLSYTRHSTYGRFARLVPTPDVEYMENNCLAAERGFCTWKSQRRLRLQFADRVSRESNLTACQDRCTSTSSFYCRSISFEPSSGVCALSHHSGRSLSDQRLMLKASPDAFFSEIGNCFSGKSVIFLVSPISRIVRFHVSLF